jgi:ParB-like chromosome segregation protein Spo0J
VGYRAVKIGYDIIAGNSRYEACKILGWKMIPVIVREPSSIETIVS